MYAQVKESYVVWLGRPTCKDRPDFIQIPLFCVIYLQKTDVDCGQPTHSHNTALTVNSTKKGGTATYSCIQGFIRKGGDTRRRCLDSANWSGTPLLCQSMFISGRPLLCQSMFII